MHMLIHFDHCYWFFSFRTFCVNTLPSPHSLWHGQDNAGRCLHTNGWRIPKNASSHKKKDPLPTIKIVVGPLEETMGPSLRWRVQSWKHGQTNMLNISCHQPISVPVIDGIFFYALAGRRHSSGRSSVIRWYQRSLFIHWSLSLLFRCHLRRSWEPKCLRSLCRPGT